MTFFLSVSDSLGRLAAASEGMASVRYTTLGMS